MTTALITFINKNSLYKPTMKKDLSYNWYDNPDEVMIKLDKKGIKILYNKFLLKFKTKINFHNKTGLDKDIFYQLNKKGVTRVKTLKKLLQIFNMNYNDYNKRIISTLGNKKELKLKFPIKLSRKEIAVLVAAFMSDGNNQKEHPFYSNIGFLGNKIIKATRQIVPNISYEFRNEKVRFHPILGRILNKAGVPYGNKTILNPNIPNYIKINKNLSKLYLTQAFDDEGHAATKISRKIVLGRSVAVKDLPNLFIRNMPWKEKIYFNNLPDYIKKIVIKNPPRLLVDEYKLLKKFKINSSMRCRSLTKYEETNSADWVIEIFGKENIRSFNNFIGFSQPEKIERMNQYLT